MKKALTAAARSVFHHAGGTWATRLRYRNAARILMYHRFSELSVLEEQCMHLKKHYQPLSLTEIGWCLKNGTGLPHNSVVFTVDDGYRDFFLNAFPVLSAYSIPAIVFLATDMLDQGGCLWVDWVRVLFSESKLAEVRLEFCDRSRTFRLTSSAEKQRAAMEVKEHLKKVANADRLRFLDRLPASLGFASQPPVPEEYAPLDWAEVRLMHNKGIEFGAHTKSHPILSRLKNRQEVQQELAGSKERIEEETGSPVLHFCYPNGMADDFDSQTVEVAQECGFLTAVTGQKGVNFADADPLRLRRIHQEPWNPGIRFAQQVAGQA